MSELNVFLFCFFTVAIICNYDHNSIFMIKNVKTKQKILTLEKLDFTNVCLFT